MAKSKPTSSQDTPIFEAVASEVDLSITEGSGTLTLTPAVRRYLVQIYRLINRGETPDGYISTSALADLLNVSAPAVNRMVTRLREVDLIDHEPYQGIRLTGAGEVEALKQLRLHRIAENFLTEVMGFKWHEVHEEADRIASDLSPALAARMWIMSGEKARCPHGESLPSEDGTIPPLTDTLLTHASQNVPLIITRVRTREPDRLEYLAALGLVPGADVEVMHAAPFNGPLQLKMGREFRIVGHNLAEMLRVEPI